MPVLRTTRLLLLPLSLDLVRRRIDAAWFKTEVEGLGEVTFPRTWPGDPLPLFPELAQEGVDPVRETYIAIDREALVAIGQLGAVGPPDHSRIQEIGYGVGVPGQGFATEAVEALVAHLLSSRRIAALTARTARWNVPSQRVLEKNRFKRIGTGWDPEDGELILWERRA